MMTLLAASGVRRPGPAFTGTLLPNGDAGVGGWEGDSDESTNLHDLVNDGLDTNWVRILDTAPVLSVCATTENDSIDFNFDNPSTAPNGQETVEVRVKARYELPIGGTGSSTMRIRVRELTTTRATRTGFNLTTSFAWFSFFMTQAEKDAVGDWNDIQILADMDSCVDTLGDELRPNVSQEEMVFT